ncbi:MAG TPA: hypothetical protein DEF06_01825 [Clostridiales bacterium]|nr:hypothetical protein [Clostridiales bacterium]
MHGNSALILDTPKNTEQAHKFYEKAGFQKVEEARFPVRYDHPYDDSGLLPPGSVRYGAGGFQTKFIVRFLKI